jgi:hypothetical protein
MHNLNVIARTRDPKLHRQIRRESSKMTSIRTVGALSLPRHCPNRLLRNNPKPRRHNLRIQCSPEILGTCAPSPAAGTPQASVVAAILRQTSLPQLGSTFSDSSCLTTPTDKLSPPSGPPACRTRAPASRTSTSGLSMPPGAEGVQVLHKIHISLLQKCCPNMFVGETQNAETTLAFLVRKVGTRPVWARKKISHPVSLPPLPARDAGFSPSPSRILLSFPDDLSNNNVRILDRLTTNSSKN